MEASVGPDDGADEDEQVADPGSVALLRCAEDDHANTGKGAQ